MIKKKYPKNRKSSKIIDFSSDEEPPKKVTKPERIYKGKRRGRKTQEERLRLQHENRFRFEWKQTIITFE